MCPKQKIFLFINFLDCFIFIYGLNKSNLSVSNADKPTLQNLRLSQSKLKNCVRKSMWAVAVYGKQGKNVTRAKRWAFYR